MVFHFWWFQLDNNIWHARLTSFASFTGRTCFTKSKKATARLQTWVHSDMCCCLCLCYTWTIDVRHIVKCTLCSAVQLLECNVQCNCSSAICQCTSLTHFGLYQHPYTSLGITSKSKKMFWGWVQYFWKYSFSRTVISCLRLNWPSASGPVLRHYLTYSPILHVEPANGYGLSKFCSWEDRQKIISKSLTVLRN